jgi:hypothetical protein
LKNVLKQVVKANFKVNELELNPIIVVSIEASKMIVIFEQKTNKSSCPVPKYALKLFQVLKFLK